MARPLRIERVGGRHHVVARGNERRAIFRDDKDRTRFIQLLAELPDRFGTRLHAWVLMDNHYHLLIETPEANLSRAIQWLGLAYSVWFNKRHQRSGHLFQGRFGSFLVGDDASWLQVARYVHLNPVRVAGLGLGKSDRSRQRSGAAREPQAGLVARRLQVLRSYRWSSYRAHAGLEKGSDWLWTEFLSGACGGRDERSRRQALRRYHEEPLREGKLESIWERVVGGAVMGSEAFVASVRQALKEVSKGVSGGERWRRRAPWEAIVAAVEREHGGRWEDFRDVYGDWGRDAALYVGRHLGRMRLRELAEKAGGLGLAATGQAVSRVARRRAADAAWRERLRTIEAQLSKTQM